MISFLSGLLFSGLLFAAEPAPPAPVIKPTSLTRETASNRSKQIGRIAYVLWFGLDPASNQFEGRTVINFDLKPKAKEHGKKIEIDFEEGSLHSVTLNGTAISNLTDPNRFDGHHLFFSLDELLSTSNRLQISFTHPYSTNGNGLHRFKDPEDGKIYIYSNFEPYNAHRMFPCFDQPDLKATFELTVEAPPEWEVIANAADKKVSKIDGRKSWEFPPTSVLSTYLFALHAGPYHSWKGDANGIPIRLFSRKSLSQYVNHEEWLKVTKEGLDFFGTQFGFPYPFGKYDQLIVPDFNAGAMENVGAVTFSERFVHRTRLTMDQRRGLASVILHEMAHMWFGDLVTMKWWNGLWLNESFATFMSAWALDQGTSFKGSWQSFFSGSKQSAYWEDQLVTTHPIELPVPDTDHAEANFDGITYGKGASSLKQLSFYLGEEDFKEGIQRYFQKFAYRNTTLADFIKMLAEASSKDLNPWQHSWLQTSGVNSIQTQWECKPDVETGKPVLTRFDLLQTASPDLRVHRTQVALYRLPKNKTAQFTKEKPVTVTYSEATTSVKELIGKPCPDFVFPNDQDYDYVKVDLDAESQKIILKNLSRIPDPLTRQMIWHTLWEMVVDGKIKPQDYADTVLSQAASEKDTIVLSRILRTLVDPAANRFSVVKVLSGEIREKYFSEIETWIKKHLNTAPAGDLQLAWYQGFLDSAHSPSSVRFAKDLLDKKQKLKGLTIDQERRWELLLVLARNGFSDIEKLIQAETEKDPSDLGEKSALLARASIPDPVQKKKWLEEVSQRTPESPSLAKEREVMRVFQVLGQETMVSDSVSTYFEALPKIALSSKIEDQQYSVWYGRLMFPSLCDPKIVQKTTETLNQYPSLPSSVIRYLKIHRQEEERCIRSREKSISSG